MRDSVSWAGGLLSVLLGMWVLTGCGREGGATGTAVDSTKPAPVARKAPDWPMFRGNPALTGVTEASLPSALSLKWSFKAGGQVLSSAAIVEDKVYVGSTEGTLVALNLKDGSKRWQFKAGGPVESSPLILEGKVFFGDSNTNFYALDATTGSLVWHRGADAEIKAGANWMKSPDGKGTWVLAGSWDNKLYCWDAATGQSNWVYETGNRINGAPAAGDGVTVFGGCDALIHVVQLADGKKVKEIEAGAYIAATAALTGGRAYVGHYENEFLCVDLAKGEVVWRYRDRAFPFMSSPAVTADRVLVGSRDKRLHCLDRATGQAIWTFATRGKVESSPVVAGDKVVVGSDDGRVYLVALGDGRELWNYEIGQPVQASPAVVDGHVVIGADDGVVYCFAEKK